MPRWAIWVAVLIIVFFIVLIIYSMYEPFEDVVIDAEKKIRRTVNEAQEKEKKAQEGEQLKKLLMFTYGMGLLNGKKREQHTQYPNYDAGGGRGGSGVRISEIPTSDNGCVYRDRSDYQDHRDYQDRTDHHTDRSDIRSDWTIAKGPICKQRNTFNVSKGERGTNEALRKIFNKEFYTTRPDFLKNPKTKRNLELDCYNHQLAFAVEYNGRQHYEYPNGFHKSKEEFLRQVERDKFKRKMCDKNGIFLLSIPWTVPIGEIEWYIRAKLPSTLKKYASDIQ